MAYQDFNPYDLSAYNAPKSETKAAKPKATKPVKAVVRRVGIGPVLHSRFSKLFVLLAMLFFLSFGSYTFTTWWLLNHR